MSIHLGARPLGSPPPATSRAHAAARTAALGCALVIAGATAAPRAGAQDRWAVIVATTRPTEMQRASETAEHSGAALAATVGGVIPADRALARVESQISEPFRAAPPEIARRLGQAAEAVLEDVAFGRNQQALDVGQPILAELDPHLAGLGRDEQTASDVANLCLYLVRAHVQKRDVGAARQQVQLCLRLVPDLRADERLHPPAVRDLLSEARRGLEQGEGGILAVHAAPTDPEGCAIRVNGRPIGQTPWARVPLPPGTYVAQVECETERAGRLHPVTVSGESPTRIVVRARLAQTLQTRPTLSLVYPTREAMAAHVAEDVAAIAQALDATRVLAAVDDGRTLVVRAFAVSAEGPTLVGSAPVPEPVDVEHSREAVAMVLSGQRVEAVGGGAGRGGAAGGGGARRGEGAASGGGGPNVAGIVLGTLLGLGGAAGLGVGWYYWVELDAAYGRFDRLTEMELTTPEYTVLQDRMKTHRWGVLGAGIAGGTLLTVALPFLLPDEDGVPWWSLVIAAGGAALAGVAIWQLAEPGRVLGPPSAMQRPSTEPHFLGALLMSHAVPLLSVPLVYLVREATGDRGAGAAVEVEDGRAMLRAWGTF